MYDPHLHLLIDDDEIDARWNLTRMIGRPDARSYDPVMRADQPWEGQAVGLWTSVHRDPESREYRMWYRAFNDKRQDPDRDFLCYATSSDGLRWDKPQLDQVEYEGTTANNIYYKAQQEGARSMESHGVTIDQQPGPRRYKAPCYHSFQEKDGRAGIYGLYSPDGITWEVSDTPILPGAGDRHSAMWDPATRRYLIYTRHPRYPNSVPLARRNPQVAGLPAAEETYPYKRIIALTTSSDYENWSDFQVVMRNDDFDSLGTQFYSISPIRYGNRFIAFVDLYDTAVEKMWVTLASSMDGVHWNRPLRSEKFLDLGAEGRWDDSWVNITNNPPVAEGANLRFWYMGRPTAHALPYRIGSIGSFLLGRDRFAALVAGHQTGQLMSDVVTCGGPRLFLNAGLRNGSAAIELRTAAGEPIPGRTLDDCDQITGDNIDHPVTWDGDGDLSGLEGQPLRVRIRFTYGQVFAYRFGTAPRLQDVTGV